MAWTLKIKRSEQNEWTIDWADGKLASRPPQLAQGIAESISSNTKPVGYSPTGPFAKSNILLPYVAYKAAVQYLWANFHLTGEATGDFEWPNSTLPEGVKG